MCMLNLWQSTFDQPLWERFFNNSRELRNNSSSTIVAENSLYFDLLRQWLLECAGSHKCAPKEQFWPKRTIFVGNSNSKALELWVTESKKAELSNFGGYIALSHCWGLPTDAEKEQFCTTRKNYDHRLKGFSMDDLPKTFTDAVQVTRELGKQHLWIDAVCIIQAIEGADDVDWKNEAGNMELVFGSAYCTIAASSATAWTMGFFEWNSTSRYVQDLLEALENWNPTSRSFQVISGSSGNNTARFAIDIDAAPLNQRAWVVQEKVLSRRTISFTEGHTYWECGVHRRCGDLTKQKLLRRENFLLDPEFPQKMKYSGYFSTIEFIQFLFEKYANSRLTRKSDREVAISGLVKRMEGVLGSRCRYGVFDVFIYRLLLWKRCGETDDNETHYRDQHLPSWSWMIYSRINFLSVEEKLAVPPNVDLQFDKEREKVLLIRVRTFENCTTVQKASGYFIVDGDSVNVGVVSFDIPGHVCFQHCVVLGMKWTQSHIEDAEKTYYVLLVKRNGLENQYERIGRGEVKARCVSKHGRKGELC